MARGHLTTQALRCPRCRPIFGGRVRTADGRKTGWVPEGPYVGFLRTSAYEGYKKAPVACPECGTTLEGV